MKTAYRIERDLCRFGLTTPDSEGIPRPARKATSILTNMPTAKLFLEKKCLKDRDHFSLEGSAPGGKRRTALAQVYPKLFVDNIIKAIVPQKKWDSQGMYLVGSVSENQGYSKPGPVPREEECGMTFDMCFDDVTGAELRVDDVRRAREEELKYYRDMEAFKIVPTAEAWATTKKPPPLGSGGSTTTKVTSKDPMYDSDSSRKISRPGQTTTSTLAPLRWRR